MDYLNQSTPRKVTLAPDPISGQVVHASGSFSGNAYGLESDSEDSQSGLVEYLRILRRNAGTIVVASLMGLILGFAIGIPMKPVYRAKTSLEVLTINEDFMNMKQANPTTTNDSSYDTSEEQTQAKLLESTALLDRVIAKMDPTYVPDPAQNSQIPPSGWRNWLHLSAPPRLGPRLSLITGAASSIKVKPTTRTRVLEVTVDSTDRQIAKDFANTLAQEFMEHNMEARWAVTQRTSEWLRRELDDARDKLRKSEDALQDYARGSGLIFTDETTNVATEKLQQLQQNLSTATADRITKQSRFELAQNAPPASLADVLADNTLRETQSKINDLKRQVADLNAIYDPEYSKLRRAQAELDALQAAFDSQRADIIVRIKNDYTESERREKLLAAAYYSQAQEVTGQDEKAIQYNILKRDVDSSRQLYDTMLQQMKQASITSAMRASNVRVVDPAKTPGSSVFPNFKLNTALGGLAGMFLSIIVVTLRERADRTLQEPGNIKLWLDLQELGTIPGALSESRRLNYFYSTDQSSRLTAGDAVRLKNQITPDDARSAVELVTFQKKPSLMAEAFRSTLTSILFIGENGSRPRVLVFTSANAADGKTTVSSNIAIAAAEIRCRVLVVDADLRRPRMHQIFHVANNEGLVDILQNDLDMESVSALIQHTSISGLDVLTAGAPTSAAAHLLYSPNFARVLEGLRKDYDMILIDTPPMLQMTDARVVARLADAVILVARAGKTTRDALFAAKERLTEDRTRILGTVLNDWDPKRAPVGYNGYTSGKYYSSHYYNPTN